MSVRAVEEVSQQVPADDFHALENKVYRTIELYKAAREARVAAERDVNRLREQVEQREEEIDTLKKEVISLRREREEVRSRVEKMLREIDSISEEAAAAV
jgi:predicted  nucleic acid-binding Zn-ribbon protein